MFKRNYSFLHHCLLFCRNVMFQKRILSKPNWGAQAVVRGHAPPRPPIVTAQQSAQQRQYVVFKKRVSQKKSKFHAKY